MAVASDGSYGITKDLMYSYPIRSNGTDWEIVKGLEINEFSQQKMKATEKELLEERDAVKALLV